MNIFVANLNLSIQNDQLKQLFEDYGQVDSAKVIMDRQTNRSKGYGFVEMPNEEEGLKAIQELDGAEVDGRPITCKKARPKEEGGGGGREGGFRSNNRGGGGGGYQRRPGGGGGDRGDRGGNRFSSRVERQ